MGKVTTHIHHFTTGEFSVAGLARIDQEVTRLAAETQENILSHAIGKGQCRPGTTYLATTPSSNQVRLLPFVRSVSDVALLELSNLALRVYVNDVLITRPTATSTVTNGDFSSSAGWTTTASSGAAVVISGGFLSMNANARGSSAFCERSVTTSSAGVEHALRIVVTRGPVRFRCGSSSGAQDYIAETVLDTGHHSLAFTPSGTYYVRFLTRNQRVCVVDSIQVESAGVLSLTAPWTTAQLRDIRFDQSADVLYLANVSWQPRKIERRATRSWSVVAYESDDGPFRSAPASNIKLTPAATHGNTTLASDSAVFSSAMVGSLIRLYHERFDATVDLAGDDVYTDIWTIRGISSGSVDDRVYSYEITGTWVGTLRNQRSFTGTDGDFNDYPFDNGTPTINVTANVSVTRSGDSDDNNLIAYNRIGFIDGSYTSGSATIAVQYEGFSGYGVGRITAFNSSTSVDIEVLEDFNADTGTRSWEIGSWSDTYGWPSAVVLFDGRLWWGGNDDFWGSASDAFTTFDDLAEGDSATIKRKVATGGSVSQVNWFLPLQRLIVGTTGAEVSVRSSNFDEPLTPTNITLKDASTMGSRAISPVKMDSRGIFVHRSGASVHALLYSFDANDYVTQDLTALNEDICGDGVIELATQRQPESYVWAVREDGQLLCLIYDWQQKVQGWSRVITDGTIESVCTLPADEEDAVYIAVARTINGSTVRYVERFARHSEAEGGAVHKMADSGVFTAGPVTSVTATHLANETGLVGWGTPAATGVPQPLTGLSANGSGVITLPTGSWSNVWVGLGYTCKYKSSRLAYGSEGGTALLQSKRVSQLGLLLANTHRDAVRFGGDFTTLRRMEIYHKGKAMPENHVYTTHDAPTFAFPGTWDTDSRVCLQVSAPYPATFLGLVVGVETNEK